jgi:ankyrin repeat protein
MHTRLCNDKHRHDLSALSLATPGNLNISSSPQDGDTALFQAAYKGHVEASRLLLESKADVNAANHVCCGRWSLAYVG